MVVVMGARSREEFSYTIFQKRVGHCCIPFLRGLKVQRINGHHTEDRDSPGTKMGLSKPDGKPERTAPF